MGEDFELVEICGLSFVKYLGASSRISDLKSDIYIGREMFSAYINDYAREIPRTRNDYPEPEAVAADCLDSVIMLAWLSGIPSDILSRLQNSRVVMIDTHGNNEDQLGWYAMSLNKMAPIKDILDKYLSMGYETVIFSSCNPGKEELNPSKGSVIYPLGILTTDPSDFEMVVRSS